MTLPSIFPQKILTRYTVPVRYKMSELWCRWISSQNEDIYCWAAPGPRVEPIGGDVSRLVK